MWAAVRIALTVLIAVAGGLMFKKLHIPTPLLTGSIVAVAACSLLIPELMYFPASLKTLVQICSGAVIGSRVSRKELREMKTILLPAIVLLICLILFNMVCAIGMYRSGLRDIPTAMFASAPGGMSDMTIMAPDFGADPLYVAVIQFCRLLFVNTVFPSLILFIDRRKLYPGPPRDFRITTESNAPSAGEHIAPLWLTALLALCGGLLFRHLGIPAGAVLGSVVFVALTNLRYDAAVLPAGFKYGVQAGIGCYVGVQMTRQSLLILQDAALPVLLLIVTSLIYTYLCALLLYRVSAFDFTTCMLMCSPGGLNEMSIIADDLGADAPKVAVMHSIRILSIVAFFYHIIPVLEFILE
jgi:membrane AbrB-like protein